MLDTAPLKYQMETQIYLYDENSYGLSHAF